MHLLTLFLLAGLLADDSPQPPAKPKPQITAEQRARFWHASALINDAKSVLARWEPEQKAAYEDIFKICGAQPVADEKGDLKCPE